jgi:peptide/nickel transport system substrate-binding protein
MKREPTVLYFLRFVAVVGLFVFMGFLYWSSLLLEEDLRDVKGELNQLHAKLDSLQDTIRTQPRIESSTPSVGPISLAKQGTHIDPSLPNLLEEDPYYAKTLPKQLGKGFTPWGTRHLATIGRPDNLHPFSNWAEVGAWNGLCNISAARSKFGIFETYAPDMAIKMEARPMKGTDAPEYWVHLRAGVFWQPLQQEWFSEGVKLAPFFLKKHPVTAHDFKFYIDAVLNPYNQTPGAQSLRSYLSDISEVEVIDDLTFVVRWKTEPVKGADGKVVQKIKYIAKSWTGNMTPLAGFVYKYFPDGRKIVEEDTEPNTYRTNSVWAQNFAQHWAKNIIVSNGAWVFDGMTERMIRFRRNPDHFFPLDALTKVIETEFKDAPDSVWQEFKAGGLDSYAIRPDQLLELEEFLKSPIYEKQKGQNLAIHRLDYVMRSYAYIGWNQAKPQFKSKKVRRAMTMAIDRQRIIRQNLNGMGIETTCPFFRYSPAYDPSITPWPYDVQGAKRLLEEEGWYDSEGTGVLTKDIDGKKIPFRFSLTYYVKNPVSKSISEYIAMALKEIKVVVDLHGVDIADISAALDDKSFDAYMLAWTTGAPPEDPKQLWYSTYAKEKGSSNTVGFANTEVDKIIDELEYEYDKDKRIQLYHRFDAIIHEEAPYTFLYTPKIAYLYRDYLQNVFIPADRQDLIPGANVAEPDSAVYWLRH